jgi:hypothetical protein
MKSMRDLLAIVDQNRQNLNENIQTAPRPGVPQLGYNEFDPEPAVDPNDPSLSLPDRFTDGDDSIDVPMNFDNKEDGDVLKEQGSQDQDVITRADAIWDYTPYDIKVENEKYRELVDLIDQGKFDGLDVQEAAGKFMQMVDPSYEPSDSQDLAEGIDGEELANEIYAEFERIYPNLARRANERTVHAAIIDVLNYGDDRDPAALAQDVARAVKRDLQQGVAEGQTKFAGEKVGQKPGDQVRGTEKAKSSKTRHPFQGRLVGGAMESQTYHIKHRGTGEIFESFDNLARAQRRYSQLGELQADYRLTKKR